MPSSAAASRRDHPLYSLLTRAPALITNPRSGRVTDWVANTPVALEVQRRFRRFLRTFTDDKGQRVYMQRIEAMVLGE